MAASTPVPGLSKNSQDNIIQYYRACTAILSTTWNIRNQMLDIDRLYMREQDFTKENVRARVANRYGDATKFQNVTAPVVMPAVESAVTYQTSTFLTGIPIFDVNASARYQDAAIQMSTMIDAQAQRGGWVREFELFFRDGFKYNLSALEVSWCQEKIWTPKTDIQFSKSQGKPTELLWEGNKVKRLDPYNMIFDARYKPTEMAWRGEFAGYTEPYSKVELITLFQSLQFRMNYKNAMEAGPTTVGTAYPMDYYIPELNPEALLSQTQYQTTNWLVWAGIDTPAARINYKNIYFVTTFYCRIIPSDFLISGPGNNQPQIWKFLIVNGNTVIYAERLTNAHNLLPILMAQPMEDGLGYQTKSFAQNVGPMQQVASALINSAMASRRRAISDRGIYDPSRINAKDINNDSPNAKIAVRPAAYGKPLNEAYFPIPYRDDQIQFAMSDMAQVLKFADQISGQNPVQQGQFVKGNKTQREFESVMGNAQGRNQAMAIKLEVQVFTPLKEILKLNILQYGQPGSYYNRSTETDIDVDPLVLREAQLTFKVSDGLMPSEKVMSADSFAVAAQTIASSPQLQAEYNLGDMFSYLFKTQRADVAQFQKGPQQVAYESALAQWQQAAQVLAQTYASLKKPDGSNYTPQEIQAGLPPQPTPDQYGYVPGQNPPLPQKTSIMQQYTTASASPPAPPQATTVGSPATQSGTPTLQ